MAYYTYILYSESRGRFYKGSTNDVYSRFKRHNYGYVNSTSTGRPWRLLWYTCKDDRGSAIILERKLKNLSAKKTIEFMLKYESDLTEGSKIYLEELWSKMK